MRVPGFQQTPDKSIIIFLSSERGAPPRHTSKEKNLLPANERHGSKRHSLFDTIGPQSDEQILTIESSLFAPKTGRTPAIVFPRPGFFKQCFRETLRECRYQFPSQHACMHTQTVTHTHKHNTHTHEQAHMRTHTRIHTTSVRHTRYVVHVTPCVSASHTLRQCVTDAIHPSIHQFIHPSIHPSIQRLICV